jgi:hypothetical protein
VVRSLPRLNNTSSADKRLIEKKTVIASRFAIKLQGNKDILFGKTAWQSAFSAFH